MFEQITSDAAVLQHHRAVASHRAAPATINRPARLHRLAAMLRRH